MIVLIEVMRLIRNTWCINNINVVLYSCQIFLDHNKISRLFSNSFMGVIYEIHKYQVDDFQYVVASTNKYPETQVKNDVERMNSMLNESLKTMGIKYVFVASDTSDPAYKVRKKKNSY